MIGSKNKAGEAPEQVFDMICRRCSVKQANIERFPVNKRIAGTYSTSIAGHDHVCKTCVSEWGKKYRAELKRARESETDGCVTNVGGKDGCQFDNAKYAYFLTHVPCASGGVEERIIAVKRCSRKGVTVWPKHIDPDTLLTTAQLAVFFG